MGLYWCSDVVGVRLEVRKAVGVEGKARRVGGVGGTIDGGFGDGRLERVGGGRVEVGADK